MENLLKNPNVLNYIEKAILEKAKEEARQETFRTRSFAIQYGLPWLTEEKEKEFEEIYTESYRKIYRDRLLKKVGVLL